MASGNTLLRNRGDGTFEDTTVKSERQSARAGSGARRFADFDNDGWQDIYAADGWVYNDKDTEIELDFLNNVVSQQKRLQDRNFLRSEALRHTFLARLGAQPVPAQSTAMVPLRKSAGRPVTICC